MRRFVHILLAGTLSTIASIAQDASPLHLVTTIPLPNVSGRFDHSTVDMRGQRLFVTGRDANTVEVVDLRRGRLIETLPGFPQPQGAYYDPTTNKLFVSTRDDGACKIIDGRTLKVVGTIKLSVGANVIAYDPGKRYLYIGHGGEQVGDQPGQKRDPGQIAIVDVNSGKLLGNIETDPVLRPGAIIVEEHGPRLFTTNALGTDIVIIDRNKRTLISKWALPDAKRSGTIAFDESRHRLFVGQRNPSRVIVLDSDSGKQITIFPTVDGIDRLLYDPDQKRLYSSGSEKSGEHQGALEVYSQIDADHFKVLARMPTGPDGGTSLLVPEMGKLYITLPRAAAKDAEILVYDTRSELMSNQQ